MKHISGKRIIELALERSWVLVSQRGSHAKLRNPITGEILIVPIHANRDLATGLQKALMKTLGVEEAEL